MLSSAWTNAEGLGISRLHRREIEHAQIIEYADEIHRRPLGFQCDLRMAYFAFFLAAHAV